jgi:hypothetical protein
MTYAEKAQFFRAAFEGVPLAEFDGPEAFAMFRKMSVHACRVAEFPFDEEWPLAALEVLREGSPAAKEYYGRTKEHLS